MVVLPQWARIPKHAKEVIATERGWVVKETGELLKMVADLPSKLEALEKEVKDVFEQLSESTQEEFDKVEGKATDEVEKLSEEVTEASTENEEKVEDTKQEKPRRGRPPKAKSNKA